jgi:hypothetical protein
MTQQQMEHALKVMYEEIKTLKQEVKGMQSVLDMFATLDLDASTKKRNYWNIDNHKNR